MVLARRRRQWLVPGGWNQGVVTAHHRAAGKTCRVQGGMSPGQRRCAGSSPTASPFHELGHSGPPPGGVSADSPRLGFAYAQARSARPRREPRIRRPARSPRTRPSRLVRVGERAPSSLRRNESRRRSRSRGWCCRGSGMNHGSTGVVIVAASATVGLPARGPDGREANASGRKATGTHDGLTGLPAGGPGGAGRIRVLVPSAKAC
jgi:hypothetical protein